MIKQNKLKVGLLYLPTKFDITIILLDEYKLMINLDRKNLLIPLITVTLYQVQEYYYIHENPEIIQILPM